MFEVDPWVIIANSFDFMHLRYVHGLEFDFDESSIEWGDGRVAYQMTFTMPDGLVAAQHILVTGTNTVSYVTGGDVDSMGLFTSTPVGDGSQSYYMAASPHGPQARWRNGCDCRSTSQTNCSRTIRGRWRRCASSRVRSSPRIAASIRYLRYVRSFPTNDPSRWLS